MFPLSYKALLNSGKDCVQIAEWHWGGVTVDDLNLYLQHVSWYLVLHLFSLGFLHVESTHFGMLGFIEDHMWVVHVFLKTTLLCWALVHDALYTIIAHVHFCMIFCS